MKFFVHLYTNFYSDLRLIEEAVIAAEKLGFDGALLPDHYMFRKSEFPYREDRNATLDSWVTLAYLAKTTERIQLGTFVTPIPFRPPSLLAKMVTTLDLLSKGRVVLGIGAGWGQGEFEGYSEWNEPKIRVEKTQEGLELMVQLWTQNEVTFNGKYYKAIKAILEPKPVQKPYPKLLFGGHKDKMLDLAGRFADIAFLTPNGSRGRYEQTPDGISKFEEKKQKVLRAAKRHKRARKIAFMYGGFFNQDLIGPFDPKEASRRVDAADKAGAEYFIFPFPFREYVKAMKKFAKAIIPSFN